MGQCIIPGADIHCRSPALLTKGDHLGAVTSIQAELSIDEVMHLFDRNISSRKTIFFRNRNINHISPVFSPPNLTPRHNKGGKTPGSGKSDLRPKNSRKNFSAPSAPRPRQQGRENPGGGKTGLIWLILARGGPDYGSVYQLQG